MALNAVGKRRRELNGVSSRLRLASHTHSHHGNRSSSNRCLSLWTVSLNAAFFCLGMSCAFIGPCLHHLQSLTNTTLSQISLLFVSHAAGSMFGSVGSIYVLGGTLCSGAVAVSLVILAALLAVVPWCSVLTMLLAVFTGQGLACGIIATKCLSISRHKVSRDTVGSNHGLIPSSSPHYDAVSSSLSQYLWFGVGAVAVTLLAVVLSATLSIDGTHGPITRHKRELDNTVPLNYGSIYRAEISQIVGNVHKEQNDENNGKTNKNIQSVPASFTDGSKYRDKIRQHGSHGPTRHRRELLDTVPQSDIVLNKTVSLAENGTVPHIQNGTMWNNSSETQLSNSTHNFTSVTSNVSTANLTTSAASNLATATTPRPLKPHYADGKHLKQELSSADGSQHRDVLRKHLGPVPKERNDESNGKTDRKIQSVPTTSTSDISATSSNTNSTNSTNNGTVVSEAENSNITVSGNRTLQDIMKDFAQLAMTDRSRSPLAASTNTIASTVDVATKTLSLSNISSTSTLRPASQSVAIPHTATKTTVSQPVANLSRYLLSTTPADKLASSTTVTHSTDKPSYTNAPLPPKQNLGHADGSDRRDIIEQDASKIPVESNRNITAKLPTPAIQRQGSTTRSLPSNTLSSLKSSFPSTPTTSRSHKPYYVDDSYSNSSSYLHSSKKSLPCQVILFTIALITLIIAVVFGFSAGSSACFFRFSFSVTSHHSSSHTPGWCMLATMLLLHFFLSAIQWTYSCLVVEYARSFLVWRSTTSIALLLVFWACFSAGRIISYLVMGRVRPGLLIFTGVVLSSVCSLVMLLAGLLQRSATPTDIPASNALVWFSSALLGFSVSVVLPAVEHYIPSSFSLSVIVPIGAGLGQATVPLITALLADMYSPSHIMKVLCVAAFGLLSVAVFLKYIVTRSSIGDAVTSRQFHLVDEHSSVEEYDTMMVSETLDEEQELLSPNDVETSLINHPVSSSPLRTRSRIS